MDAPSGQGNILVSAGVRVLKVPKRRVIELIPKGHMEVFQENFSPRHRSEPSNQAMFKPLRCLALLLKITIMK